MDCKQTADMCRCTIRSNPLYYQALSSRALYCSKRLQVLVFSSRRALVKSPRRLSHTTRLTDEFFPLQTSNILSLYHSCNKYEKGEKLSFLESFDLSSENSWMCHDFFRKNSVKSTFYEKCLLLIALTEKIAWQICFVFPLCVIVWTFEIKNFSWNHYQFW